MDWSLCGVADASGQRAPRSHLIYGANRKGNMPDHEHEVSGCAIASCHPAQAIEKIAIGDNARFGFIDSLRGLAALSVAAYHIFRYGPVADSARTILPDPVQAVLNRGWIGVQMFFVISGFVIAYTLRSARLTPRYIGNFALRRSLRLDPPYWLTILLVMFLFAMTDYWTDFEATTLIDDMPSWQKLLSHVFYLQNVLGYGNISVGFWTLCIEVQFYLLFAVMLWLAQRCTAWRGGDPAKPHAAALLGVFAPLGLLSLFVLSLNPDNTDWVVHFFAFFFLGALAWWTLDGRTAPWAFWSLVAAIVVRQCFAFTLDMAVALVTGVAIYLAIRTGRRVAWLENTALKRMGRVSYSLYLIHYPISWIITTLGYELTGENPVWALFWLLASIAASVGIAQGMHALVENPAIRFAARFKPAPPPSLVQPILVQPSLTLVAKTRA